MPFPPRSPAWLVGLAWMLAVGTTTAQRGGGPAVPTREGQPVLETGSSSIAGRVVTDEAVAQPVRRAAVSVRNSEAGGSFVALTDDAGRFEFRDLPAGRFTVLVNKPGYVSTTYGAKRLLMPGLTIALADGQRVADLVVRMPRGAVVTGRVVDEQGQPALGLRVVASERVMVNGEPSYRPGPGGTGMVDDRGVYRIYGLPAGSYVISASAGPTLAFGGVPRMTTAAEVQWAQSGGTTRPGMQPGAAPAPPRGQGHRFTTIYYPGTTDHSTAAPITVAAGEERSAVDFVVSLVPTATVEGTVVGVDGRPAGGNVQVLVLSKNVAPSMGLIEFPPRASVGADGRFSVSGLAPGQYVITARAASASARPMPGGRAGAPPAMDLWAIADLSIAGLDVSDVALRLAPGMNVSGRIAVQATTETPPADLSRVSVRLVTPPASGMTFGVPPGQANADGSFNFVGVSPGSYYVTGFLQGGTPARPAWTLTSATLNGRNVLDTPFEVRPGEDVANIVVTFTDRLTTLSGSLTDQAGRPAPGYFVMAFPVNATHWWQQSRWLRQPTRPASDGRFSIVGLPPGEYFLAAITEFSPQEWYTPAFLQQLVPLALKLTLREGEEHRQDIRLAGN